MRACACKCGYECEHVRWCACVLAGVRMCVCVLVPFYSIRKVSHPVTVAKIVQLVSIRDGEAWLEKTRKERLSHKSLK